MSTASDAAEAAWEASDAGKAAWDAAKVAAWDAAKVAYYAARDAYLAKTVTPVHDREPPANYPAIPESCPLCVKECTGACES